MSGNVARGISYVFASEVVRMVAKGGILLLLTRYLLEPAEYGLLSLTLSVLGVLMLFGNLGITKAGARYVNEYREQSPDLVPTVIRRTLTYNGVLLAVVSVVILLFHERIAAMVGEPAIAGPLLVGAGYIVAGSFQGNARYFFHGFNRMELLSAVSIATHVLLLLSVPLFVYLGFGLEGVLSGYVLSYGVPAVAGLAIIYDRFYADHGVSRAAEKEVSRRILRYNVPLTFTMGANVVNSHADRILLSLFRGPTAIAFYTLGKQISAFIVVPARSLGLGTSPTLGEQKSNDKMARAADLYERAFVYTVAVYAPAVTGLALVADPTIRLVFGADYAGAVPVLQIFSVYVFVQAIDMITTDALDYLGRARARAIAKGLLTVGNVTLNLLLIPPFGIVGATVATVTTYAVYVVAELFIIADELPLDARRLVRSAVLVGGVTLGMAVVVYPLTGLISNLPSLAGVIALGGAAWLVLTVVSGVVDPRRLYAMLQ